MIRKGKGQIVGLANQLPSVIKWLVLWMWGQQWMLTILMQLLSLLQCPCRQTEEAYLDTWTTKWVKSWQDHQSHSVMVSGSKFN